MAAIAPCKEDSPGRDVKFSIRQAASLEDLVWIMQMAEDEGWGPREKDAECYFAAGLTSQFYIGEANGQRISSICILKYSDTYHYVGKYFVIPACRGKGYGMQTWKFAMSTIQQQNIVLGLDAVVSMAPEGILLVSGLACEIGRIVNFAREVLGAASESLLQCWLNLETSVSVVALDQSNSSIVGFLLLVKDTKGSFNAFPFLGDDKRIACSLLANAVKALDQHSVVVFKVPDCNQDILELMDSFRSSRHGKEIRMFKNGKCHMCVSKIYSISALD